MVKKKKEDASSTSTESVNSAGIMADDAVVGEDEGLELFYDEDIRFGETRMVEVSGVVEYVSPLQENNPVVSGLQVDPMFSYDGDLEQIEPLDIDDKDKKAMEDELFVFAAIGDDDKVVMSPVDNEPSIVEFYGGTFNPGMPAPKPVSGTQAGVDKRIQPFCNFSFDAEYPYDNENDKSLTKAFVIMKYKDYSKDKTYKKDTAGVLWYKETPDKIIDGKMDAVENKEDHSNITLSWDVAAYDIEGNPMTTGLYTMIYYAPQGDDGEVNYVADGNLDEDPRFHYNAAEGTATFSFNPKDYVDDVSEISPYEYVWIKVSDGVNGLDLYSDEYTLTKIPENKKASAEGTFDGATIKLNADINYSKGVTYTGKKITSGQIAYAAPEEIVDPDKGTTKKNIVKLTVSGMQVASGTQLMTPNGKYPFTDLFKVSIKPNSKKKVGQTGAFTIKLSLNTKVFNKAGYKGKAKTARKKELKKLISALNTEIKKTKYEYVIEPVNLTFADDVTIKATYKKQKVTLENGEVFKNQKVIKIGGDAAPYTLKSVKSVKVKVAINGITKPKTFTIKGGNLKKQFKLTVADKDHQLDCLADIEPAATDSTYKGFFKGKRKEVKVKK